MIKLPEEKLNLSLSKISNELSSNAKFPQKSSSAIKSNTTCLAIKYNNGVLIAADTRTTEGYKIFSHTSKKIDIVSPYSAMASAGLVAAGQWILEVFLTNLREFELENGLPLNCQGQAKLLKAVIKHLVLYSGICDFGLIFAGYDQKIKTPQIYHFDEIGGIYEMKNYITIGSGGRPANAIIKLLYQKTIKESDAINIAIKALMISGSEDIGTEPPELTTPHCFIIDQKGIRTVSEKVIKKIIEKERRRINVAE